MIYQTGKDKLANLVRGQLQHPAVKFGVESCNVNHASPLFERSTTSYAFAHARYVHCSNMRPYTSTFKISYSKQQHKTRGWTGSSGCIWTCAETCWTCVDPTQLAEPKVQNKPKAKNEMCKIQKCAQRYYNIDKTITRIENRIPKTIPKGHCHSRFNRPPWQKVDSKKLDLLILRVDFTIQS